MSGDVGHEPRSLVFLHYTIELSRLFEVVGTVRVRILGPADNAFDNTSGNSSTPGTKMTP